MDGLVEGAAHRGAGEVALDLVAEGPGRQAELGVEGMDARMPGGAIADSGDAHLSHHRHDPPGVGLLVGQAQRPVLVLDDEGVADVAVAAAVQVRLQRQPSDLAAPCERLPLQFGQPDPPTPCPVEVALQVAERPPARGGPSAHGVQYAT